MFKSSWIASNTKDSTTGKKPIKTLRIQRSDLSVRKHGGSDIDWFNLCGDQATHFISYTKSPNVSNFSSNHTETGNTFNVRLTMCVSYANKGKTQVRWATTIG
jgi:hypothetical protein